MPTAVITSKRETLPPPKHGKGNGKSTPAQASVMTEEIGKDLERLRSMGRMGKQIEKQRRVLEAKETVAAEAESALKEARGERNAAEHILQEMLDDLAKLANGNFIERLPFASPEPKTEAKTDAKAEPKSDAWRDVKIADVLAETGAPASLINPLRDGKVKFQNDPAGITTVGRLADFTKDHVLTDIGGLGKAKAELLETAMDKWWAKHPLPKEPANSY